MKAGGTIIAVISSHEPFTVSTTHTLPPAVQAIFTTVSKGYNLNPTTGLRTDFFYHGTATKALYADLAELYLMTHEYDP